VNIGTKILSFKRSGQDPEYAERMMRRIWKPQSYLTMMGCKEKAAAKMQLRMGQTRRSHIHVTTTHISALLFPDIHKWHDRRAMLITMTPESVNDTV
jgi:hypothetical protein